MRLNKTEPKIIAVNKTNPNIIIIKKQETYYLKYMFFCPVYYVPITLRDARDFIKAWKHLNNCQAVKNY